MEYIQLNKQNVKRFGIKDSQGNDTGEYLEFDLEDLGLPIRYQKLLDDGKKSFIRYQNKLNEIEKISNKSGKKAFSLQDEKRLKALNDYYAEQIDIMDNFLGKGKTMALLCGRKPYIFMFDDIAEALNQMIPELNKSADAIKERIKEKYGDKVGDILE